MSGKKDLYTSIIQERISLNIPLADAVYKETRCIGASKESFAFIITALELIYQRRFKKEELCEIITDGRNDNNFDAIYINNRYIDIFDCSKNDPVESEMIPLAKSIENFILSKPTKYTGNDRVVRRLKLVQKHKHKKIRLFVMRMSDWKNDDSNPIKHAKESIEKLDGSEFVYYNIFDLCDLSCGTSDSDPQIDWEIEIDKKDVIVGAQNGSINELFVKIPVHALFKFQKECDEKKYNLFNKNIRVFLNNKNLSPAIIETIEDTPEKFHIFHNGITITTPNKIKFTQGDRYTVSCPQVVNGAQTVNSIYSFFKNKTNLRNLKDSKVFCKIVYADSPELIDKICETSNSQVAIKNSDLRSNDDVLIKIENYINSVQGNTFFFVRKGAGNFKNKKSCIQMSEFIQWFYASEFMKPAEAKNSKKKLFDITGNGLYPVIKDALLKKFNQPDRLLYLCKIALYIKLCIKNERGDKNRKSIYKAANLHLIAVFYIKNKFIEGEPLKNKKVLEKLYKLIIEEMKKQRKNNPNIQDNYLFTKSEDMFNALNKAKI